MTNEHEVARARAHTMRRDLTPSEVTLWTHLRNRQLGVRFRRQHPIGPYIVDFACLEEKLIVEADGAQHDNSDHDRSRDAYLRRLGYRILRFENHDVASYCEWVLEEIRSALR